MNYNSIVIDMTTINIEWQYMPVYMVLFNSDNSDLGSYIYSSRGKTIYILKLMIKILTKQIFGHSYIY